MIVVVLSTYIVIVFIIDVVGYEQWLQIRSNWFCVSFMMKLMMLIWGELPGTQPRGGHRGQPCPMIPNQGSGLMSMRLWTLLKLKLLWLQ